MHRDVHDVLSRSAATLMLARARKRVLLIDAGRPRNRFAAHSLPAK